MAAAVPKAAVFSNWLEYLIARVVPFLADAGLVSRVKEMVERFNARGPYAPYQIDGMRRQVVRMLSGRGVLAGTRAIGRVCPVRGAAMRGGCGCGFPESPGPRPRYGWPVPDNGRVLEMTREEFEELVAEALDRIPPELTRLMDNVAVFVEDEPPTDDPELLGLYEGTPLTDRGEWYAGVLPDRITIYRGPTLRMCETREDVVAETEVTVVHEIAHHFGIDDERLHALGYG